MTRFIDTQRIIITTPMNAERAPLRGLTGTVHRLRRADDLAWIRMDADLPDGFAVFPDTMQGNPSQPEPRRRDIMMDPEECQQITNAAAGGTKP